MNAPIKIPLQGAGEPLDMIPVTSRVFIYFFSSIAVVVIIFLCLGSYSRKVTLTGVISAASASVEIFPMKSGYVEKIWVADNKKVKKGDPLFEVALNAHSSSGDVLSNIESNIAEKNQRLATEIGRVHQMSSRQRADAKARLELIRGQVEEMQHLQEIKASIVKTTLANLEKDKQLLLAGFISDAQFKNREAELLRAKADYSETLNDKIALERELKSTEESLVVDSLNYDNQVSQLSRGINENRELSLRNENEQKFLVVSPVDGVVSAMTVNRGESIHPDKLAMVVTPSNGSWRVELYATSKDIGFLRVGREVKIRYEAFPYQRFGIYRGTITEISHAPVQANSLKINLPDAEKYYKILVKIDKSCVMAYGKCEPLQDGMRLSATIETDRNTLIEWMFDPVRAIKGSL